MNVVCCNDSVVTVNSSIVYGNNNTIVGERNIVRGNYNLDEGKGNTLVGIGNVLKKKKRTPKKRKREEEVEQEVRSNLAPVLLGMELFSFLQCTVEKFGKMEDKSHVNILIPTEEEISQEMDEDISSEDACVICLVRKKTTTIVDCKDRILCARCARDFLLKGIEKGENQKCPKCRTEIVHGAQKRFLEYT
jgi:PHP family Zn ribbon phosphoesterase